jgi:hypothetical protein
MSKRKKAATGDDEALAQFREAHPQFWLNYLRLSKVVGIQGTLDGEVFPEGSCFLHANVSGGTSFCLKRIIGTDLGTCQVTAEIYGDDNEEGVVILPLEVIEWFSFPTKAVPLGIHFEGFTNPMGHLRK